jgi:hypothetical protein
MFAEACRKAASYTRPLVINTRQHDGKVNTETATFMVVNRDGWVISAGHVFDSFVKFQSDQNKIKEVNEINSNRQSAAEAGAPNALIKVEPTALTNHSFWWGWDGVILKHVYVNRQVDIAVAKLDRFNPDWVKNYPVFADPAESVPGTSLCRLGYPFININADFDTAKNNFRIPALNAAELIFPNDGIHTRTVKKGVSKEGNFQMTYIETSTPGLKGQSGGPIFDTKGRVHAMQVSTMHIPLGFHPTVEYEGRNEVEHQFLNVGLGLSTATIRAVLDSKNVKYDAEGDETGFRIVG